MNLKPDQFKTGLLLRYLANRNLRIEASPVLTNFCVAMFAVVVVVNSLSVCTLFDLKLKESKTAKSTGTINIKKGETEVVNFFILFLV